MPVDKDKIINGTPEKILRNSYMAMKENYNEATAKEFFDKYSKMDPNTILSNIELIASEPMYGLPFLKKIFFECNLPCISKLQAKYETIEHYYLDNSEKMSTTQKELYENFLKYFKNYIKDLSPVMYVIDSNNLEEQEYTILDNIRIGQFVDTCVIMGSIPIVFLVYLPFIIKYTEYNNISECDIYDIIDELKENGNYNKDFFRISFS